MVSSKMPGHEVLLLNIIPKSYSHVIRMSEIFSYLIRDLVMHALAILTLVKEPA